MRSTFRGADAARLSRGKRDDSDDERQCRPVAARLQISSTSYRPDLEAGRRYLKRDTA